MKLIEFILDVLIITLRHKGSVTSWVRTEKRNTLIGGNPNSRHLIGEAFDIVFDTSKGKRAAIAELQRKGYHVLDEKNHVHVQLDTPKKA